MGCHFLLQGLFSAQGLNLHLLIAGVFFTTETPAKTEIQRASLIAHNKGGSGAAGKGEAQDYPPEKAMAPHSSTLAWKIPWAAEPGRLQSMGLLRFGHG